MVDPYLSMMAAEVEICGESQKPEVPRVLLVSLGGMCFTDHAGSSLIHGVSRDAYHPLLGSV